MLTKFFSPIIGLGKWFGGVPSDESSPAPLIVTVREQAEDDETVRFVRPYTMTSPERIRALCQAVRYIEEAGIVGAIVECGVWRGGSMMAAARTLLNRGVADREIFLFDTFEGMTEPGPHDISIAGESAGSLLNGAVRTEEDRMWCYAPIHQVSQALALTNYPQERVHLIPGRVEDTLISRAPEEIALLRLDTDWYESTRHEMEVLFPRLRQGGVLIIDDYGHWQGARKAVDEYVRTHRLKLFLHAIDYTGRIAVKAFE
ncbi:TylF/MycF/NovP-related O-methyltransferase [Petrachloros mirabilis]